MERSKFIKAFNNSSCQLDKRRIKNIIKRWVNSPNHDPNIEFIMCMEELSELSQQISKLARDHGNKFSLVEEMADVAIVLVHLQELCDISTNDLYKAMNVKIDRIEKVLNETGEYV